LPGGEKRIRDRSQQLEYDSQINLLDRFCEAFFRKGKHPYACFGSGTEGREGSLRALRERLLKDLRVRLGIPEHAGKRRDLKGLAAYQSETTTSSSDVSSQGSASSSALKNLR
jgi:hypothetical protein